MNYQGLLTAMTRLELTCRYVAFAIVATGANLVAQELTVRAYIGVSSLYLAIAVGTLVGLVCKYLLDKHYIFALVTVSKREDADRFLFYSLTGVVTTMLFWGFELGFEFAFSGKTARYVGAVIGLSLGYALKYQLDKRFVFGKQEP